MWDAVTSIVQTNLTLIDFNLIPDFIPFDLELINISLLFVLDFYTKIKLSITQWNNDYTRP